MPRLFYLQVGVGALQMYTIPDEVSSEEIAALVQLCRDRLSCEGGEALWGFSGKAYPLSQLRRRLELAA